MNTTSIVIGAVVALLGIGILVLSSAFEKLAKSGEIPAEKMIYLTAPTGRKLPLLSLMGSFILVPGVLLVAFGMLNSALAS